MENGKWKMENGKWKTLCSTTLQSVGVGANNGKWKVENEKTE